MRIVFAVILIGLVPVRVSAGETRRLAFIDRIVVIEEKGPAHSDWIALAVRIEDNAHHVLAELPPLDGPVLLSPANRQVFACETYPGSALSFRADGKRAFAFRHIGYLRQCGLVQDEKLYWLHYNTVEHGTPLNTVVVLDAAGSIVHRSTFDGEKVLRFSHLGKHYSLSIPPPELPG